MEYVINKVPFAMAEISQHLFNSQFLSDITFMVDNKKIYAHSFELMKRSPVFIKQLEPTCAEKKLIPITDYGYDVFYHFVRFIYTDSCEDFLNEENCDALFNLANDYKVIALVNVVQKYKKIELENSHEPYGIKEVSQKFFNLNFLSDITFIIDGKVIYAHSLELMKRSSVFQQQLEQTVGEKKKITISDYGYDTFYQCIRFIYTDKCDARKENCFDLLKLAIEYKIISLVNYMQNSFDYNFLKLANYCDFVNSQITLFGAFSILRVSNLAEIFASDEFITARQETIEEILKFDEMATEVTEKEISNALCRWMEHYCVQNKMKFSDCRKKFDKFVRLIRFPTMSNDELRDIQASYPALLTDMDIANIGGHKIFGSDYGSGIWSCTPRKVFSDLNRLSINLNTSFRTKFFICSDLILTEFIVGKCYSLYYYEATDFESVNITISYQNSELETPINININLFPNHPTKSILYGKVINLGSSICLRAGFTYTIDYKFVSSKTRYSSACRGPATEVIISAPTKSVKIVEAHESIIAMYFLKPDG